MDFALFQAILFGMLALEIWHWGIKKSNDASVIKGKEKKNVKRNLVDLVEKNMRWTGCRTSELPNLI